jgi:hypothetical protein
MGAHWARLSGARGAELEACRQRGVGRRLCCGRAVGALLGVVLTGAAGSSGAPATRVPYSGRGGRG